MYVIYQITVLLYIISYYIYNIICHFKSDQIISCHIMLYYSTLGHIILYCVCLRYIEPCAHSGRACFQAPAALLSRNLLFGLGQSCPGFTRLQLGAMYHVIPCYRLPSGKWGISWDIHGIRMGYIRGSTTIYGDTLMMIFDGIFNQPTI